jgi:hypothetical protein
MANEINTESMTVSVKKLPTVWRISSGAWCMDVIRSAATDRSLRTGTGTLTVTTQNVSVSIETRLGTHTSTRTEVVGRSVKCSGIGAPLTITTDMVRI